MSAVSLMRLPNDSLLGWNVLCRVSEHSSSIVMACLYALALYIMHSSLYLILLPFHSEVDLYQMGSNMHVKINGQEVPMSSLPYQHPSGLSSISILETAQNNSHGIHIIVPGSLFLTPSYFTSFPIESIVIKPRGQGLSLNAPKWGLQEVYFGQDAWKVNTTLHRYVTGDGLSL